MGLLVPWQNAVLIQQTSSINEHPEWESTDIGVQKNKFVLNVNAMPDFSVNPIIVNRNLSTGISNYRKEEIQQIGENAPKFTLSMGANSYNLSLFFWLLMQNGGSEATTSSLGIATFIPYASDNIEIFSAVVKLMIDSTTCVCNDTVSHLLTGCICESITLTSEERGVLLLTAEMIGSSFKLYNTPGRLQNISNFPRLNRNPIVSGDSLTVYHNGTAYSTVSKVSSAFTDPKDLDSLTCEVAISAFTNSLTDEQIVIGDFNFPDDHLNEDMKIKLADEITKWSSFALISENSLRWQDAKIYLNSTEVQLPSFTITLRNNVVPKFSDEERCYGYSLGKFKGEGSFFIPFLQTGNTILDDFRYGTDRLFQIYWGTVDGSTADDFSLTAQIRYTDIKYTGDLEIGAEVSFDVIYDGSQQFTAICSYSKTKLERGIV